METRALCVVLTIKLCGFLAVAGSCQRTGAQGAPFCDHVGVAACGLTSWGRLGTASVFDVSAGVGAFRGVQVFILAAVCLS